MGEAADITGLVRASSEGNADALRDLFAAVYGQIKRLARRQLAAEANATMRTTELVHETYMRLVQPGSLALEDRAHFFSIAARAMRHILIDQARARNAVKRGGRAGRDTLDEPLVPGGVDPVDLIHLDNGLERLAQLEPKLAELVNLRYFAGLSVEQVAELRGVATRTVLRDWRRARVFLFDVTQTDQG
ncbi:MAG: ECF-type sigma factor [Rudaea sp.]|nr:ECF-type sigma factor [Rudaea sp.]